MTLTRRQKLAGSAAAVLLAAVAIGVGTLGDGDGDAGGGGRARGRTALDDAGNPVEPRVVIALDRDYRPDELPTGRGLRVSFRNEDDVDHTFTADDGLFDSRIVAPGEEFTFSFDGPRTVGFHCEIHPSMRATVVVE